MALNGNNQIYNEQGVPMTLSDIATFIGGGGTLTPGNASVAQIQSWASSDDFFGFLSNLSGALETTGTTATVTWPDGTVGVYTTYAGNVTYDAVDTWTATYLGAQYTGGENHTASSATPPTRDSTGLPIAPFPTVTVV